MKFINKNGFIFWLREIAFLQKTRNETDFFSLYGFQIIEDL